MTELKIGKIIGERITNYITSSTEGSVRKIIYNRPDKSNAFKLEMYIKMDKLIHEANKDNDIKFIVIIGEGKNFCTGNDLSNFQDPGFEGFTNTDKAIWMSKSVLEVLVKSIITSNKPIFAVAQGMCTGFGFTQLALFDKVFAVEGATFKAPLVKLAQGPEVCSSYLFPKCFGKTMAQEILIEGRQVSVDDLIKKQFVDKSGCLQQAHQKLNKYLQMLDRVDYQSFIQTRNLLRHSEKIRLLTANQMQCKNLVQRWSSPALTEVLMKYLKEQKRMKKAKL